jgi:hypothetical protein
MMMMIVFRQTHSRRWTVCVVKCSEFLTTDPEAPGSISNATRFSEMYVVGLERVPLSLVSKTEELLEWKSSGSGSRK